MRSFSITDLERLSGIKAHTIRTWEKRFNLILPDRTQNNVRCYSTGHMLDLLNIALLLEYGHKISKLAPIQDQDIAAKLSALKSDDARQKKTVNRMISTMFSYDIEEFELLLDSAIMLWGIDVTIECVILPFLEKVNLVAYNDTSVAAHLVVTGIRRKLILGIEKLRVEKVIEKTALLYLPEGEHYDLLLLYMNYKLKKAGLKIYYLGTNISLSNLASALQTKAPDIVCSYIAERKNFPLKAYTDLFSTAFPHLSLHIAYADRTHIEPNADKQYIKYCQYSNIGNLVEG